MVWETLERFELTDLGVNNGIKAKGIHLFLLYICKCVAANGAASHMLISSMIRRNIASIVLNKCNQMMITMRKHCLVFLVWAKILSSSSGYWALWLYRFKESHPKDHFDCIVTAARFNIGVLLFSNPTFKMEQNEHHF